MAKPGTLGNVMVIVTAICAVLITAVTVADKFGWSRSVFPYKGARSANLPPAGKDIQDWEKLAVGHRMGPEVAPVTVIEFGDFECPACRRFFVDALRPVRRQYPTEVSVVFRHWPLPYHKFALITARVAECAAKQGRFEAMHDLLYAKQDSFGIKSFTSYAREAGIGDTVAFATCTSSAQPLAAVASDTVAAHELGSRGTPTIIINGHMLGAVPDSGKFAQLIGEAMQRAAVKP